MPTDGKPLWRFAVTVAALFVLAQLIVWPLAYMAPVFAILMLQAPRPMPWSATCRLLITTGVLLALGVYVSSLVLHYPPLALALMIAALAATFRFATSGGSPLMVVFLLVATLLLPLIALTEPQLSGIVASAIWVNLAIGIAATFVGFALIRPTVEVPSDSTQAPPTAADRATQRRDAMLMTLAIAPLGCAFLIFGLDSVITLIFAALLSQQLLGAHGHRAITMTLVANMVGVGGAILGFVLLSHTDNVVLLCAVAILLTVAFGRMVFSGRPTATLWGSALTACLVVLGGSLLPFGADAEVKAIDRVWQIAMAGAYLIVAAWFLQALIKPKRGPDSADTAPHDNAPEEPPEPSAQQTL